VVELLGLAPLLARSTAHLSGGERQRVALGRALLSQPKLLLMDEPLSSLDAGSKAEILPYLERLHRSLAIPALYISHDAGEIARLADHLLLMQAGKVTPGGPVRRMAADLAGVSPAERDGLARAAIRAGLAPEA
ncbi:MAG TPA: ATP-binding cassette domain-containing protein, partial [Phenylobacterium sp.]